MVRDGCHWVFRTRKNPSCISPQKRSRVALLAGRAVLHLITARVHVVGTVRRTTTTTECIRGEPNLDALGIIRVIMGSLGKCAV